MTKEILETENEEWGFFGTTLDNYDEKETQERWKIALRSIQMLSGKPSEDIRIYLDSRSGRKLADACCGREDLVQAILEEYYKWVDKDLFSEEDEKNPFKIEKDTTLFGTVVFDSIRSRSAIVLYTFKNPNRILQDYAVCVSRTEDKYTIGMNYITPIDN